MNDLARKRRHVVDAIAVASLALSTNIFAQMTAPSMMLDCAQLALAEPAMPNVGAVPDKPSRDAAAPVVQDGSCWIELDRAGAPGALEPTWIDVRPAPAVSAARIPGALQIPLSALPTKEFLKHAPVVLIGTGRDDGDLGRACGELKRHGFQQVKLLRGGVRAWYDAGRLLLRDAALAQTVDRLSPLELHRQAASAPWAVVSIDVDATTELPRTAIRSQRISVGGDFTRAVNMIRRIQVELAGGPDAERPNAIVAITRDEHSSTQLSEAIRRAGLRDVLTLEGGAQGYQAFLVQQQSIAANAGKPLLRPCGSG
jgi:rhodanese-related sulfurtransferase